MIKQILKVKLLGKGAKAPCYAHEGDAGLDMFTPEKVTIKSGQKVIIDTRVALEIPKNTVALIWDKSGLACRHGIKVLGGVFDEIYRGSYTIGLINLSDKDYTFEAGEKICQLLIQPIITPEVEVVDEIETGTPRGEKRMGSSGR